jgi:hypothetical protein
MNNWMIIAIIGSAVGIIGGIVGAYVGITRATGRERTRMVWLALIMWLSVASLVAGLLFIPHPYRHVLSPIYALVLWLVIRSEAGQRAQ